MKIREWKQPGTACDCACGCGTPAAPGDPAPRAAEVVIERADTAFTWRDRLGALRVRLGIGRMHYRVRPGLYAVGTPGAESPVLVSANYKLSFDHLRRSLVGRDAWLLVLDTRGINVWCAAGKGLFSTDEVVRRVEATGLASVVAHRKLVVPQLGAPGVAAHEVRRRTGFRVVYGPVRASDLPAFLDARMTATPAMRRVTYTLRQRAVLVPVEVVLGGKYPLLGALALTVLAAAGRTLGASSDLTSSSLAGAGLLIIAFLWGSVLGPLALPWLPGRAFSLKGAALGLVLAGVLAALGWPAAAFDASWLRTAAWVLMVPALTSFVVMNFTGSSNFTSLSGVLREMRVAMPLQGLAVVAGVGLWVSSLF